MDRVIQPTRKPSDVCLLHVLGEVCHPLILSLMNVLNVNRIEIQLCLGRSLVIASVLKLFIL